MNSISSTKKIVFAAAAILLCCLAYYLAVAMPARNQVQATIEKHRQTAGRYMQEKNYAAAAQEFRELVRINPDDPDALMWLGTTLYRSGQKREAAEALKKLVGRNDRYGTTAKNMLRNKLNVER